MRTLQREQPQKDNTQYNLTTHLSFILKTLEYVVLKLSELARQHSDHEVANKKRSFIKIYDKKIEKLPMTKTQKHQYTEPAFDDKVAEITEMLEEYMKALPKVEISQFKKVHQLQYHVQKWLSELSDRIQDTSRRTESLQVDMGDLILLYKDVLLT